MTDRELIAKKLALIETSVHELKTLARPEAISHDVREERFVVHTLQIAIQNHLDDPRRVRAGDPCAPRLSGGRCTIDSAYRPRSISQRSAAIRPRE